VFSPLTYEITLLARSPENAHPAWGTMPPAAREEIFVSNRFCSIKERIIFLHSSGLPGYQLPAKMAFLMLMMPASHNLILFSISNNPCLLPENVYFI
jgi:hypothetical protein